MNKEDLRAKIVETANLFRGALTDFGLYEVWSEIKYGLEIGDDDKVKALTLDVVREMLRGGARVDFGDDKPLGMNSAGDAFEQIMTRIQREWDDLGRPPGIGDVCYIEYPPRKQ